MGIKNEVGMKKDMPEGRRETHSINTEKSGVRWRIGWNLVVLALSYAVKCRADREGKTRPENRSSAVSDLEMELTERFASCFQFFKFFK